MSKYTVTLTANSVKSFEIDAHTADEAIAIMYDIRQHTDMLNFNERDVTEMTATAEPSVPAVPPENVYDDDDEEDDIIVEQIHTAATNLRFALQLLLDSVDSLEL